ncbi:MAG: pyridoxine 5'-phosphate synthase [Thermodesulfobacteriota bacterium]|nr:pyridoxine 5'-phosphate synthase [Thermodesulfobacteriota bacterium]
MAKLAVNVDHIATVRQARRTIEPDPVTAAAIAELAGAEGIIIHLREDRRHIQDRDLHILKQTVKTKLNLEMAATEEMISIAGQTKPDMVTLVPEKREELTTEGGLDVSRKPLLKKAITTLKKDGILVSLFINPEPADVKVSRGLGADFVEIHTGRYADAQNEAEKERELSRIRKAVETAHRLKLRINAGHGLNYINIKPLVAWPEIEEFSIGHSIIARAVLVGMEKAVREMLALIRQG